MFYDNRCRKLTRRVRLVNCSESLTSRELVLLVGGLIIKIMLKMYQKNPNIFSDVEEFGKVMMKLPVVIRNEELKVRMRTKTKKLPDVCCFMSFV